MTKFWEIRGRQKKTVSALPSLDNTIYIPFLLIGSGHPENDWCHMGQKFSRVRPNLVVHSLGHSHVFSVANPKYFNWLFSFSNSKCHSDHEYDLIFGFWCFWKTQEAIEILNIVFFGNGETPENKRACQKKTSCRLLLWIKLQDVSRLVRFLKHPLSVFQFGKS